QDTVGIRIPHHPVAQQLLQAFGSGLAAPSANRFGRISPTTAAAVREELGDTVDYILDGGPCEVGVESTIVDVTQKDPVILRPGMISSEQIAAVLKKPVLFTQQSSPRVSGSLESHYAPRTPLQIIEAADLVNVLSQITFPVAVLARENIALSF